MYEYNQTWLHQAVSQFEQFPSRANLRPSFRDITTHHSYEVIILGCLNMTVIWAEVMVMCPSHIILNQQIPPRSS